MAYTESETSKYVQAGDIKLHYNEAGEGDTVIAIHGGGPGASGWSNWSRNFDTLAGEFRTLLIDLPGFGKSQKLPTPANRYAFYCRTINDMMDELGIAKAHFIGNSLGGGTSIKMALTYPERVERMVLMGPGAAFPVLSPQPSEGIKHLQNYYAGDGPSLEKMKAFTQIFVWDPSKLTDELIEGRYKASIEPELMENPPQGKGVGTVPPAEALWREDLTQITHEILMIWGRDDRVLPLDGALILLKQFPNCEFHVYSQCGHWAQWEKADKFNRQIPAFLNAPK